MNPPQNFWQFIILIVAAVAAALLWLYGKQPPRIPVETPRPPGRIVKPEGRWERLANCTLVDNIGNDGDSFQLRCGAETHTFRLYYADCPEKYRHQYNGERIAEQGAYFGGLSEEETIAAGQQAKEFALKFLSKGPVTVETRWEPVYDSGRYFAFVSAGGQDLGEALVERGLARIYTKGVERMDGRSNREQRRRLERMESEAKAARRGAWGRKR